MTGIYKTYFGKNSRQKGTYHGSDYMCESDSAYRRTYLLCMALFREALFREEREEQMNKEQLIEKISDETGFTKTATTEFVNAFTKEITAAVTAKDDVRLIGFGTFTTTKHKARNGFNPSTGKVEKYPAKTVVKFRPGAAFSEKVAAGKKKNKKK